MPGLNAHILFFRARILEEFSTLIEEGQALPEDAIKNTISAGPFDLSDSDKSEIIKVLEGNFTITQSVGHAVNSEYAPWLASRRSDINFFYWNRLNQYYLATNELPPSVVSVLNNTTDELLDYIGNPAEEGVWKRRGMVMGHVQSGKTTNYSGLICKSADAGYRVIILLAGLTNSLRSQTQERLDENFLGKESFFGAHAQNLLPITRYGSGVLRFPHYGTSRDKDFSKSAAQTFGISLAGLGEPIIFVLKKNKKVLETLRDWLREQNYGSVISEPLLVIDDEADNASVNTSADPDSVTAINKLIREILGMFSRSSYIGYTATPFANIFIDPETKDAMLEDDLFPRHFIKALDPPSNYVGASRVFSEEGNLREKMVREISDYRDILPLSHKKDRKIENLPDSLFEAIRVFYLSRAVRILRGQGEKHCSMMINVSRFNDIQSIIEGLVYTYHKKIEGAVIVNGGLSLTQITDSDIKELRDTYNAEFRALEFDFAQVLKVLKEAIESVSVMTINMRGGALNYRAQREKGLHVIAIGGLALSRGLTLEGLTVSYILRNTAASDTLMQMARWFGYRPGYEDLCRVYLPASSLAHYEYVEDATEELRSEVKRMEAAGRSPQDFGLKVRESPLAIRITAANKMRAATGMMLGQDYSGRHIEGYVLFNDPIINEENLQAVGEFLGCHGTPAPDESGGAMVLRDVPGNSVLKLIGAFQFPPAHEHLGQIMGNRSLLFDYVTDRVQRELEFWDVAIPHLQNNKDTVSILGLELPLRRRAQGAFEEKIWKATGNANRIADKSDVRLLMSEAEVEKALKNSDARLGDRAFCRAREKPLLLIHLIGNTGNDDRNNFNGPVVSLSFCLPSTKLVATERLYQVNQTYLRQLSFDLEPDDDEAGLAGNEYN